MSGIEPVNLILTKDALYQLSYVGLERETGFEPATPSLEGLRSSQLSYSRISNSGCGVLNSEETLPIPHSPFPISL